MENREPPTFQNQVLSQPTFNDSVPANTSSPATKRYTFPPSCISPGCEHCTLNRACTFTACSLSILTQRQPFVDPPPPGGMWHGVTLWHSLSSTHCRKKHLRQGHIRRPFALKPGAQPTAILTLFEISLYKRALPTIFSN